MAIRLRNSKHADLPFMREMLYEAVFWRPNSNKPAFEEALTDPSIHNAVVDWGARTGDTAVIAQVDAISAGAAWYRYYTDGHHIRGYINETIPVIVIAVHKNYRRQGIGLKMVTWLIERASEHHIQKLSLMVAKDNHALKLYRKSGFQEYADQGDSWLMWRKAETSSSAAHPNCSGLGCAWR